MALSVNPAIGTGIENVPCTFFHQTHIIHTSAIRELSEVWPTAVSKGLLIDLSIPTDGNLAVRFN